MSTLLKKKPRKTWNEKMLPGREAEINKTTREFADISVGSIMLTPHQKLSQAISGKFL